MKKLLKPSSLSTFTMLMVFTLQVAAQKQDFKACNYQAKDSTGKYPVVTTTTDYVDFYANGKIIPSVKGKMIFPDSIAVIAYPQTTHEQVDYVIAALNEIRDSGCAIYPSRIDTGNIAQAWPVVTKTFQSVEIKIKKDTLWANSTGAHFDSAGNFVGVEWEAKNSVPFHGTYTTIAANGCGNTYPLINATCDNNLSRKIIFSIVHGDATVTKRLEKYQPKSDTTKGGGGYHFANTTPTAGMTINNVTVIASQTAAANASATASAPVTTTASSTTSGNDGGQNSTGGSPVSFSLVLGGQPSMAGLYGLHLGTSYQEYAMCHQGNIEYYAYDNYGIPYAWHNGIWNACTIQDYPGIYTARQYMTPVCYSESNGNGGYNTHNYANNNQVVYAGANGSPHMTTGTNGASAQANNNTNNGISGATGPGSGPGHRSMAANNNSNTKTSSKVSSNSKPMVPARFASSKPATKTPAKANSEWKPVAPAGWNPSQQASVQGGNNHVNQNASFANHSGTPQRVQGSQQHFNAPAQPSRPASQQQHFSAPSQHMQQFHGATAHR